MLVCGPGAGRWVGTVSTIPTHRPSLATRAGCRPVVGSGAESTLRQGVLVSLKFGSLFR